jgi:hypothetical protein
MLIPCQPRDNTSAAEQAVSTLDTVPNFAPRMSRSTPLSVSFVTPRSRSTELLLHLPLPTDGGYLLEGALLGRLAKDFCLQVIAVCVCDLFPRNCGGGARSRTSRMPSATTLLFDYSRSSWFVDRRRNARTDASRLETDEVESVGVAEQLLRCAIEATHGRSGRQLVPSRVRSGQRWHTGTAAAYWLLAASSLSAAICMQRAR